MVQTRECDYCGDDIEPGTGTMYVEVNGTVTHFCSSKCEANADLGREARDQEWTAAGRDSKGPAASDPEPEPGAEASDADDEAVTPEAAEPVAEPDEADAAPEVETAGEPTVVDDETEATADESSTEDGRDGAEAVGTEDSPDEPAAPDDGSESEAEPPEDEVAEGEEPEGDSAAGDTEAEADDEEPAE